MDSFFTPMHTADKCSLSKMILPFTQRHTLPMSRASRILYLAFGLQPRPQTEKLS